MSQAIVCREMVQVKFYEPSYEILLVRTQIKENTAFQNFPAAIIYPPPFHRGDLRTS